MDRTERSVVQIPTLSWISAGLSTDGDGELRWDAEAATCHHTNRDTVV